MKREQALNIIYTDLTFETDWGYFLRTLLLITSFVALVACDTPVTTAVAPAPELGDRIEQMVAQLGDGAGLRLRAELTFIDASRSENALQIELRIAQSLADQIRGTSRGALENAIVWDWLPTICRNSDFRAIIDLGGRIDTQFQDPIGRNLLDITIDHC